MIITIVAGARPNFMKVAPIIKAIQEAQNNSHGINYRLVHTGQHYDKQMSSTFFDELGIPDPDINLEAGGGTQAEQAAAIMMKFEKYLQANRSDMVVVTGDVTSTMACTIVSKKLGIPVSHVEAGIRSGDMTMPEEINRIVTDSISDYFFTTTKTANQQLLNSGIHADRIHLVGNTMIDTLLQNLHRLKQPNIWSQHNLSKGNYFVITLHRPSNVDDTNNLKKILEVVLSNTFGRPIIFPVHPRTRKAVDSIFLPNNNIILVQPMGYLEFIYLVKNAKAVITDSGGITEETTVLKVPCITLRSSTERPETITIGTNELIGTDPENLIPFLKMLELGQWKKSDIPEFWDGNSAQRIVSKLLDISSGN